MKKPLQFQVKIFLFFILIALKAGAGSLKVAIVAPMTGVNAGYGMQLLMGASQAAKNINTEGGILGKTLIVIPFDDQGDPKIARILASKLAKDTTIHAILGHATSATTLAALDFYVKAKKLVITASATSTKITTQHHPYIFRMCGRNDYQGNTLANFFAKKLKLKKIAILHNQDLYGQELADQVAEQLVKLGKSPVLYQAIPKSTKDFKALFEKFLKLEVDAVFYAAFYADVGSLAKAMFQEQLQIPLITGDSIALKSFIIATEGSKAATNVMMSFSGEMELTPTNLALKKAMKEAHLETNGYVLHAYGAIQAIAAAMIATNATDGNILSSWLHHHEVLTILGNKSWDPNGDIINSTYSMYFWDNFGCYVKI